MAAWSHIRSFAPSSKSANSAYTYTVIRRKRQVLPIPTTARCTSSLCRATRSVLRATPSTVLYHNNKPINPITWDRIEVQTSRPKGPRYGIDHSLCLRLFLRNEVQSVCVGRLRECVRNLHCWDDMRPIPLRIKFPISRVSIFHILPVVAVAQNCSCFM